MVKVIRQGDSYIRLQSFFIHELVDNEGRPLNLAGCEIKTSYREIGKEENQIEHVIEIDEDGAVVTSVGLELLESVEQGMLRDVLTSAETRNLSAGAFFMGDLQITKDDDVVTFDIDEPFTVISDLSKESE